MGHATRSYGRIAESGQSRAQSVVEETDNDEDEDDSEWDSEDEDVEDDDAHQAAQQKSGKPNVAAANSRPRKQDTEWLPPQEFKKQRLESELEALHERLLDAQRIDADHLSRLAHQRCLLVKDPDDGVLQYIWDLAKVGHTLGMVGPDAFGMLMGRFAAHNRMALAEEVYAHILNYRQASTDNDAKTPSVKQKDFEHLITGLAHAGEADRAVAYLHQLAANAQSSPEAAADATASRPDDVLKNRKPIDPDTFTAVIRALTRNNDVDRARGVLRVMEQTISNSVDSRNGLMAARNAVNDPEGALRVLGEMGGSEPGNGNVWTYVEAAESYLRLGDRDRALALIDTIADQVRQEGSKPGGRPRRPSARESENESESENEDDEVEEERRATTVERQGELDLWNQVLARFVQNGRTAECFEVWRRMREGEGLAPDNRTARQLIRACVQAKNMARAHQVATNMLKFHKLKLDSAGWNEIIEGYAAEGQLETMWKYVEKMYREEGTYPGATTWDVVERTCKSHGVWDQWRAKVARLKQAIDSDKQKKAQERTMKRNQTKFTTRRQTTNKKTAVKKKANENQKVVQDNQQK